ncbi:catalytic LigB subunit of putative aromatic ring-opening dioxygenase [Mytilinidion resinicola]|uniref:Catalytic LigB subunit of putative aromatic ring-opening dioxygenase n=1 Tax=Mytilinidion resinicola TaxID=574789 RepID=A0A6A6YHR8_9PEZI|nr:catalytic LigB subunit of putative aromatic ring-opening dioxygenase [Mytilinidion resinicola]KAF2808129.1 catalytic LigB subunit of putative aromatic ring-opening dioxygenase [Mytilinidion resinicola]
MAVTEETPKKTGRAPSFFVSHGAGPFAILNAPFQLQLVDLCEKTRWVLDGWKGVILVTAHWVTDQPHISSGPKPHIYYDYIDGLEGIPPEAWEIKYESRGDTEVAHEIKRRLDKQGFNCVLDDERGWDHGVWVPMKLLRPDGDLPIVQVSVPGNMGERETPEALKLGAALESFRDDGWVILGSGSSYHNFDAVIPAIMGVPGAKDAPDNRPFEAALQKVAFTEDVEERRRLMLTWRDWFPENEVVQPIGKAEHFMPFIVNIGASGGDKGTLLGTWDLFGTKMTSYVW